MPQEYSVLVGFGVFTEHSGLLRCDAVSLGVFLDVLKDHVAFMMKGSRPRTTTVSLICVRLSVGVLIPKLSVRRHNSRLALVKLFLGHFRVRS